MTCDILVACIIVLFIVCICKSCEKKWSKYGFTNSPGALENKTLLQNYYSQMHPYDALEDIDNTYIIGYEDRTPYATNGVYNANNGTLYHIPEVGESYVQEYSRGPKDNIVEITQMDGADKRVASTVCDKSWRGPFKWPENTDAWGRQW